MRVFISSIISGFEAARNAVAEAAQSLDHEVIRAEEFSASPKSPQLACLSAVREADIVIMLLGARYGDLQPSGKSATHEEFEEAKRNKHVFLFLESGIDPEPNQADLIAEARKWAAGHFTERFTDANELRMLVVRALTRWERGNVVGQIDAKELETRAAAGLPRGDRNQRSSGPAVAISIAGAPRQKILRPSELEADSLREQIEKLTLFGPSKIFDVRAGTETELNGHTLSLTQPDRRISVTEECALLLVLPASPRDRGDHRAALIEEDVTETCDNALRFAAQLLDAIDPKERLSFVGIAARLLDAGHYGWQTRAQSQRDRAVTINMLDDSEPHIATPDHCSRAGLRHEANEKAQDLMVLLRRPYRI